MLVLFCLGFAACEKEEKANQDLPLNTATLTQLVQEDSWKVTYYYNDSVGEETIRYHNLRFGFGEDGALQVVDDEANNYVGNWQVRQAGTSVVLEMDFGGIEQLMELGEAWTVAAITPIRIEMEHLRGPDYDVEYLIMEKLGEVQ